MGPTDVTQQQLPFTPPPQVAKNVAGQMVDSTGAPLQAGTISPDKTTLAGGDGGLVWGASGPKMTPQQTTPSQNPSTLTTPASSGGGFFSKLGQVLTAVGPSIGDIGAHLAGGFGNYKPLQEQQAEKEMAIRQEQADLQGKVAQSNLQTQAQERAQRQVLMNEHESPSQTREAAAALADKETRARLAAENELGPGTVVNASGDNGNYSPYRVRGNTATPITIAGSDKQLSIAPKETRGQPVMQDNGTWATPVYDQFQKLLRLEPVGGTPASGLSTSNSSNKTVIVQGPNGPVPVQVPSSSTTTKGIPQRGGATPPPTRPAIPQSTGINQPAPRQLPGVRTGAPIVDPKAPKEVIDSATKLNDSQERYAVMQDALPKAMAGDQQAQLNLLANHLGMTMGLQKGARLNQAIIADAQKSVPWIQGIQARFGPDGYMTGVTLTPQQMNSMVDLAKVRVQADQDAFERMRGMARGNFGYGDATPNPMPQAAPANPLVDDFVQWQSKRKQPPPTMPRTQ